MLATKFIALRRLELSSRKPSRLALALLFLIAVSTLAQAQHLPLPPNEQEAVNKAIDRGVDYLKRKQHKNGTWAGPKDKHPIGYATLPALTLLECGVPKNDPIIQHAAHYLRRYSANLDTTYELSLGILFLDRLGEPRDERIIQTFALRLIAGQSSTGGWGYKCPIIDKNMHKDLLIALHRLNPQPEGMPLLAGHPPGKPDVQGIAGNPGPMPGIVGDKKPGDLMPIAGLGGLPLGGLLGPGSVPPIAGSTAGSSPGETPSRSEGSEAGSPGDGSSPPEATPIDPPDRWRDCLGLSMLEQGEPASIGKNPPPPADNKDPRRPDGKHGKDNPKSNKPYVIPERLFPLTVVQDPMRHPLLDPKGKSNDVIVTTTDNSNTQFAILALWTAQRHDVPTQRTLNLVFRRYVTSQNANGSWDYHYRFGGGPEERPAMICVGLIGLAVAYGLAKHVPAGKPVQDPRIINGFIALSRNVGQPTERLFQVPQQNLYFLWSVERVAVLYNLPKIGDKDWYRWGAQGLVTNQEQAGNWTKGQYHGSHPVIDTSLALLFLKRANLVKDLTAKLPFKPADLNNGVLEKTTVQPPSTPPPPKKEPAPPPKNILPTDPPKPAEPDNLLSKPSPSSAGMEGAGAQDSANAADSGTNSKKKWIALCLILFAILTGGSVLFFFLAGRRNREEEEHKPKNRKRKQAKPAKE